MDESGHGHDRDGSGPSGVTGASGVHRSEDSPWAAATSDASLEALVSSWGEPRSGGGTGRGNGAPARGRAEVRGPYADLIAPLSPPVPRQVTAPAESYPRPPQPLAAPQSSTPPQPSAPPQSHVVEPPPVAPPTPTIGPAAHALPARPSERPTPAPASHPLPSYPPLSAHLARPAQPQVNGVGEPRFRRAGHTNAGDPPGTAEPTGAVGRPGSGDGPRVNGAGPPPGWPGVPDQPYAAPQQQGTSPANAGATFGDGPTLADELRSPWVSDGPVGLVGESPERYVSPYEPMRYEPRGHPPAAQRYRPADAADYPHDEQGSGGGHRHAGEARAADPDVTEAGAHDVNLRQPTAETRPEPSDNPGDRSLSESPGDHSAHDFPAPLPPGYAPISPGPRPLSEQAARYDRYRQRAAELAAYASGARAGAVDEMVERPGARTAPVHTPGATPSGPSTPAIADDLDLPQRVPAEPDVPDIPADVGPLAGEFIPAETPELARIATYLRHDEVGADARPDGFDIAAVLGAVRQVPGVREAQLRPNPGGVHTLRLELAEDADPAQVSREVARLLKERMGLAAEPNTPPPTPSRAGPLSNASTRTSTGSSLGTSSLGAYSREARRRRPPTAPRRTEPLRPEPQPADAPGRPGDARARHADGYAAPVVAATEVAPSGAAGAERSPSVPARPATAYPFPAADTERQPRDVVETPPPAVTVPRARQPLSSTVPVPEPVLADPVLADPVLADSVLADSVLADSVLADSVLADPVLADPVLADPVPADPAPAPSRAPAQTASPDQAAAPRRVVINHVRVTTQGVDAIVEVGLAAGADARLGVASGPAVDGYVLRLCAVAAGAAVDQLLDPPDAAPLGRCYIEHASVVTVGSSEVALVILLLVSAGWVEQLTGSALVEGDPRQAVVRATLAAVNRRVEALLG